MQAQVKQDESRAPCTNRQAITLLVAAVALARAPYRGCDVLPLSSWPSVRYTPRVAFTLGIPEAMNHLDAATAPAPLNAPGMWWSWQGGYKYVKLDLGTSKNPEGFYFHLGGTNCEGSPTTGFACEYSNLARVELEADRLETLVVDAAALYANVDLEQTPDLRADFVAGCMAFSGDPECPAMFDALGLAFESEAAAASAQTLFSLE